MGQAGKMGMRWIWIAMVIGIFGSSGFAQEAIPIPTPVHDESSLPVPTVTPAQLRTYSADELKADFEQFKQEILTDNPLRFADRAELTRTFETQARQIKDAMLEWEFYRILSPIVAKVNCSHTYLQPSKDYENYLLHEGKFLPIEIRVIRGRAYIYKNYSLALIPVGAEVVSINDKPIQDIIHVFLNNITADGKNLTRKYYMINRNFSLYFHRFIDQTDQFELKYIDPLDGQTKEVLITALTRAAQATNMKSGLTSTTAGNPLYSQHFDKKYALLTIKSFAFYQNHSKFRFFIDRFFNEVAAKKISDLIIDLRGNSGGNPLCTAHLFSYLISAPTPYFAKSDGIATELTLPILPAKKAFTGKVRILADGGSYGATGHLISLLKYHKIAYVIGEETGGTYTYADMEKCVVLKNTQIRLFNATRELNAEVSGLTSEHGILPDVEIIPTLSDVLSGRDLVKDYAIWSVENEDKR